MIGCSVIGTPAGFDSLHVGINEEIDTDDYVDLPNREINIFPNTEIIRFIRIVNGNDIYNVFVLYNYALEINNTRAGSYYGSVVSFKNRIAETTGIITALRELAEIVKVHCLDENNRFNKKIGGLANAAIPESVKALEKDSIKLSPFKKTYAQSIDSRVFYNLTESRVDLETALRQVIDADFIEDFQSVFFSSNSEVINYVQDRGLLPTISFAGLKHRKEEIERVRNRKQKNVKKETERLFENNSENKNDKKPIESDSQDLSLKKNSDIFFRKVKEIFSPNMRLSRRWLDRIVGFCCGVALTLFLTIVLLKALKPDNEKVNTAPNTNAADSNNRTTIIKESEKVDCEWGEDHLWKYTKTEPIGLKDLTDLILNKCTGNKCPDWRSKIEQSLRDNNRDDIENDSILKFGNLVCRLSNKCTLPQEDFEFIR